MIDKHLDYSKLLIGFTYLFINNILKAVVIYHLINQYKNYFDFISYFHMLLLDSLIPHRSITQIC